MSNKEELAAASVDPRVPPRWHFAVLGASVALTLALVRVHYLFFFLALLVFLAFALTHRRKGYVVDDPKSAISLRSPLPGAFRGAIIAPLVLLAAFVISGVFFPGSPLPLWAVLVIAGTVGAAVALLGWTATVRQMAAIQQIERERDRRSST